MASAFPDSFVLLTNSIGGRRVLNLVLMYQKTGLNLVPSPAFNPLQHRSLAMFIGELIDGRILLWYEVLEPNY